MEPHHEYQVCIIHHSRIGRAGRKLNELNPGRYSVKG